MELIKAEKLEYGYAGMSSFKPALDGLSFSVEQGELMFVLGCSGAGKTTLAQCLNLLRPLSSGTMEICGLDAIKKENARNIRKNCALVFEYPEEQFISTTVAEEIVFGAKNYLGIEAGFSQKMDEILKLTELEGFENKPPQLLSAGEKRRVALAAALAYEPEIIMIDGLYCGGQHRETEKLLDVIKKLHTQGRTVIVFTDEADSASCADTVLLMKEGKCLVKGKARDILSNSDFLNEAGLALPFAQRVWFDLKKEGIEMSRCPLNIDELVEEICR